MLPTSVENIREGKEECILNILYCPVIKGPVSCDFTFHFVGIKITVYFGLLCKFSCRIVNWMNFLVFVVLMFILDFWINVYFGLIHKCSVRKVEWMFIQVSLINAYSCWLKKSIADGWVDVDFICYLYVQFVLLNTCLVRLVE